MPLGADGPQESIRTETLYAVIGAVAEGPDLDRVLAAVVDLLVEATACHACFLYLREGDLLRIRAASPIFAHVVGQVALGLDEGITGWVARNRQPAFVREAALEDPRMKFVPELQEEHFQSLAAVPLVDRRGDVIGVVVLHTQAPREFGQDVIDLLEHVASLVVGAIDNARLYEQTQQEVQTLSALSDLSQKLASLTDRQQLYRGGCEGIARLLDAQSCRLALYDEHGAAVTVASYPHVLSDDHTEALLHAPGAGRLTAQLLDSGRTFGSVHVARGQHFTVRHEGLLQTAANQLALALRTAELIESLAADSVVRRFFEALEQGDPEIAAMRAAEANWNAGHAHVAVVAASSPSSSIVASSKTLGQSERRLRQVAPGTISETNERRLRALVPLPPGSRGSRTSLESLRDQLSAIGTETDAYFGISRLRNTLTEDLTVLDEAERAAKIALSLHAHGGAWTYEEHGPYRFLVELIDSSPPDPLCMQALRTLADYDRRRGSSLLATLEAYLDTRGVTRATAERVVIHPNTLRQRLERIENLTGLALKCADLLSLELSLKLFRLQRRN